VTIPFSDAPGPGNSGGKVLVVDTGTDTVVGDPIDIGLLDFPRAVVFTPDGDKAYVADNGGNRVSVINTTTRAVTTAPGVGGSPSALAITPDGSEVYVANAASNNVSVIDTATDTVVGGPIAVGLQPNGVAITPDGSTAYVSNSNASLSGDPVIVSVIDTATKTAGTPVPVGTFPGPSPQAVAIVPDQGPTADFGAAPAQAGSASGFDGSASTDPDGTVARYDWDFGDGNLLADGGPTPSHTYATGGTYDVTLTVTDNEGCSADFVFSGQTPFCNPNTGDPAAMTLMVTVPSQPGTPSQPLPPATQQTSIPARVCPKGKKLLKGKCVKKKKKKRKK
jgi:YVTN family beta-propeller protein